jgi:hypothetical protein
MKEATNDHTSIMEEAFHYVNIMISEANVTLSVYMKHLALTLRFTPGSKEIKLRFMKVWANPPSDRKSDKEGDSEAVTLSFKRTRTRLLKVLKAIWEDKITPDGAPRKRGMSCPDHLKNIKKFGENGQKLTELFLAATVTIDCCLDFTLKP